MIYSLTDFGVFSLHVLILKKILLHVVDHVSSVHIARVEVSDLMTPSIHVLAVHNACGHHALASSCALPKDHLVIVNLRGVHLIDVGLTVMD